MFVSVLMGCAHLAVCVLLLLLFDAGVEFAGTLNDFVTQDLAKKYPE